jgi:ABC-type amino acid transport substrate-binding protein
VALFCLLPLCATAADSGPADAEQLLAEPVHLRIGTLHSPPFIIRHPDGAWSGLSVDLWNAIAAELNLTFEFEERTIDGMIEGVHSGELDAAAAALTVTEEREALVDFTHPFHTTGLAIATVPDSSPDFWLALFRQLFSWRFLQIVGSLLCVLLVVGWLVWLVEHNHRDERQDGYRTIHRVEEGLWWAAATMTTVGYGDKAPVTRAGRALGIVWMFTAIMLIASFIAAFSSALTVDQLGARLQGPQDLAQARVATVPASTSARFLDRRGLTAVPVDSVEAGLGAILDGQVDAMVYDAPLLRYLVRTRFAGNLVILPATFERQDYAFALPTGSPLREPVNRAMLRIIRTDAWSRNVDRYLGESG